MHMWVTMHMRFPVHTDSRATLERRKCEINRRSSVGWSARIRTVRLTASADWSTSDVSRIPWGNVQRAGFGVHYDGRHFIDPKDGVVDGSGRVSGGRII